MHTLEFINAKFRKELNVTVRNTNKWAERVKAGDIVQLGETIDESPEGGERMCEKIGHAQIFDVRTVDTIDDIPDVWLQCEHDRACSTKLGLIKTLDRSYGEGKWGGEGLTVVMFLRMK